MPSTELRRRKPRARRRSRRQSESNGVSSKPAASRARTRAKDWVRTSNPSGSAGSSVSRPSGPILNRSAGGKHSSVARAGSADALGSPSTITAKIWLDRPVRLKCRTSSLTHFERAACGEATTIRLSASAMAPCSAAPRSVAAPISSSSRKNRPSLRAFESKGPSTPLGTR